MPPTTRSQAHRLMTEAVAVASPTTAEYHDHSDSESELDDSDSDNIVRSPFTGIVYDISRLPTGDSTQGSGGSQQGTLRFDVPDQDRDIQGRIRELFRKLGRYESPPINLQFCGLGEEDGGEFYAFQLREITPLSIRIGTPTSRWSEPHCSCRNRKPCQHLLWLYDAIAGLALDGHNDASPLIVDEVGRLPGLEDPFSKIADFRLDLLTKGLHCDVGSSYAYGNTDWFREMEADQILSAFSGVESDDDSDPYHHRSDQQTGHDGPRPHKRQRNLEATVRELLVQNNEVFSVFLNLLSPRDKVRNMYLRLQNRVDAVLVELRRYADSLRDPALASELAKIGANREGSCDVAWASRHIRRAVDQIGGELRRVPGPHSAERADAAQALLHILETVVFEYSEDMYSGGASPRDRNLYRSLIDGGGVGGLFVVEQLALVMDQTQQADRVEAIKKKVRSNGASAAYHDKLAEVAAGMRLAASRRGSAAEYSPSASSTDGAGGAVAAHPHPPPPPVSQAWADAGARATASAAGLKRPWADD